MTKKYFNNTIKYVLKIIKHNKRKICSVKGEEQWDAVTGGTIPKPGI